MKKSGKPSKDRRTEVLKGLRNIDVLFKELENDPNLPSFGEFFMTCLVMGNVECVNLKLLYPKLHMKLTAWLKNHNQYMKMHSVIK